MKRAHWIATIYLIFGFAWIYLSDRWVFSIWEQDSSMIQFMQHAKGFIFVILSGLLIFSLVSGLFYSLLQAEKTSNMLFSNPQIGIVRSDSQGQITDVSAGLLNRWGYTLGEVVGMPLETLVYGPDQVQVAAYLGEIARQGEAFFRRRSAYGPATTRRFGTKCAAASFRSGVGRPISSWR
ncbi:MAG: hypothetical protein OHK0039_34880 [Bacteroidia bacterium]